MSENITSSEKNTVETTEKKPAMFSKMTRNLMIVTGVLVIAAIVVVNFL